MIVNAIYTIPELFSRFNIDGNKINAWLKSSYGSFSVSGIERNKDADSLDLTIIV